ncbi:MAG: alkaline phosphatase [Bacteroidales bacterium]|nr:alkaline phosphatase [Bacteroidales bacterium]
MFKKIFLSAIVTALFVGQAYAQTADSLASYTNPKPHKVVELQEREFGKTPKNIILLIADGMSATQVFAGITANGGMLNLNHMKHIGFTQTQSANNYITDSAAGGTAIATGQRVNNGAIAVDANGQPIPTILQISDKKGKATGLVSTSGITHATPASFIAHQPSRNMYEAIAADFLNTDIDIFIGGGLEHFNQREDGRDLTKDLNKKGYQVFTSLKESAETTKAPMAIFTAEGHNADYSERGEMLTEATRKVLEVLSADPNGFFVMIEGSQIDWGGHANSTPYIVGEMLDFDRAVGAALEFAAKDGETLVIVTADHETGGMTINGGSFEEHSVTAKYTSTNHTAVMIPTFAYGPGAEAFIGIYDNTDLFVKMMTLFGY